ncbi:hypothetical protein RRF57_010785 [Xylaria bambusicola]|uniref:Uncharacterized protein n=1 Tax=Xylaria bambusicola TaxID=326684 RepID=A0AAN7UX54_9PEZI
MRNATSLAVIDIFAPLFSFLFSTVFFITGALGSPSFPLPRSISTSFRTVLVANVLPEEEELLPFFPQSPHPPFFSFCAGIRASTAVCTGV